MRSNYRAFRAAFFLFLLTCLLTGLVGPSLLSVNAAPQMQAATSVVISEFRFRGPNGGNDEFIELYNPTTLPVDIGSWEIWASNNAGGKSRRAIITSGTILLSGQHYLLANNAAGGYSGIVLSNQNYATGITDDGGVALTLSGGTTIVDQVGLSAGSAYKEGTQLTSLTTNVDRGYERKLGGASDSCQDTTDNSVDFQLVLPSAPQNMASPLSLCGVLVPTSTPTNSPTSTNTFTATFTATNTATFTNTNTATNTNTSTNTGTPPTSTPSATNTGTATRTPTATRTFTNTATATPSRRIVISEIAWMGTAASTGDEWIELYNPGAANVNLAGWILKGTDGTPNITLTGIIPAGGFYLLETREQAVSDIVADQIYSGDLNNAGERLILYDTSNAIIDTANFDGGAWPAGSNVTKGTMERRASGGSILPDSDSAWITNTGVYFWGHDAFGNAIRGTPKNPNWAFTVTPTRTPTPTRTRTPTPTRTNTRRPTLPPQPLVVINEFVPRPGHDWNGDGQINVDDEYIEILNHGIIDVNLSGYSLDDDVNTGSPPYRIQSVIIKPGQRIVFYRAQTGVTLMDSGETVRLLKPNGQVDDAYTYKVAKFPDQSFCRLPDDGGADDWNQNCFPTPGNRNSLRGTFPSLPSGGVGAPVVTPVACLLPDTVDRSFVLAECPGQNIFRPSFWDNPGWLGELNLLENSGKWDIFGD